MCLLVQLYLSAVAEVHDDRHVVAKTVISVVVAEVVQCLDLTSGIRIIDIYNLIYYFARLGVRTNDIGTLLSTKNVDG